MTTSMITNNVCADECIEIYDTDNFVRTTGTSYLLVSIFCPQNVFVPVLESLGLAYTAIGIDMVSGAGKRRHEKG